MCYACAQARCKTERLNDPLPCIERQKYTTSPSLSTDSTTDHNGATRSGSSRTIHNPIVSIRAPTSVHRRCQQRALQTQHTKLAPTPMPIEPTANVQNGCDRTSLRTVAQIKVQALRDSSPKYSRTQLCSHLGDSALPYAQDIPFASTIERRFLTSGISPPVQSSGKKKKPTNQPTNQPVSCRRIATNDGCTFGRN